MNAIKIYSDCILDDCCVVRADLYSDEIHRYLFVPFSLSLYNIRPELLSPDLHMPGTFFPVWEISDVREYTCINDRSFEKDLQGNRFLLNWWWYIRSRKKLLENIGMSAIYLFFEEEYLREKELQGGIVEWTNASKEERYMMDALQEDVVMIENFIKENERLGPFFVDVTWYYYNKELDICHYGDGGDI